MGLLKSFFKVFAHDWAWVMIAAFIAKRCIIYPLITFFEPLVIYGRPILEILRMAHQDAHVLGTHVRNMKGHDVSITMGKAGSEDVLLFENLNFNLRRI
jgi:hypothetical protein